MASFVIHHIAGEQFLKQLEQKYKITLTKKQQNEFLLGNLIADSTRIRKEIPSELSDEEKKVLKRSFQKMVQEEKVATHFRDKNDYQKCIQCPTLNAFLEKYQNLLTTDFSVLGYFYHLYTDKLFFNDLFCATFECLDSELKPTEYLKQLAYVRIKKSNKIEKQENIWSHDSNVSIYQDYTVMNHLLLEHYGATFEIDELLESAKTFQNPGIEEVDYSNIIPVIKKTKSYIEDSYQTAGSLHVFSDEQVKNFIGVASKEFIATYYHLFESLVTPTKEIQKVFKK